MKEQYDFHAAMLNHFLNRTISPKISFSQITNWQAHTPYYRLTLYNGITVSQTMGIFTLFNKDFLGQFSNIVEIGSYNGGLSSYLFDTKKQETFFVSYDIDPTINIAKQTRPDIDFRTGDCFETECFNEIAEHIGRPGKTLMLCDGGFKEREFNEFSKYLKKGDIILLHDYKKDNDLFEEAMAFWQWPYYAEAHYAAIEDCVREIGLEEYESQTFNFHFWGSYIKK
jgi:hypothetical protein